jgi:O-antigen/teichoic acid export membrane protein
MQRKSIAEIARNYIFALIAVFLNIGVLQLIVLPLVAKRLNADQYGLMLSIISVVDMIAVTLGANTCNVRLIMHDEYCKSGIEGDFNLLIFVYSCISALLVVIISFFLERRISSSLLFTSFYSILALLYSYSFVANRLKRNFLIDVMMSVFLIVGYLIGYFLFLFTGVWQFIYILGYLFAFLCNGVFFGKLNKEPFFTTCLVKKTNKKIVVLSLSSLVNQIVSYADRIIMYPLLGGSSVAVYYASTLIGKCVSLAANPLNSFILSYLSKPARNMKRTILLVISISSIFAFVLYWFFLFVSKPVISFLYPQYYEQTLSILSITTASAMISVVISIATPFIIKNYKSTIQLFQSISSIILYFLLLFLLFPKMKLQGFCLAFLFCNIYKIMVVLIAVLFAKL